MSNQRGITCYFNTLKTVDSRLITFGCGERRLHLCMCVWSICLHLDLCHQKPPRRTGSQVTVPELLILRTDWFVTQHLCGNPLVFHGDSVAQLCGPPEQLEGRGLGREGKTKYLLM